MEIPKTKRKKNKSKTTPSDIGVNLTVASPVVQSPAEEEPSAAFNNTSTKMDQAGHSCEVELSEADVKTKRKRNRVRRKKSSTNDEPSSIVSPTSDSTSEPCSPQLDANSPINNLGAFQSPSNKAGQITSVFQSTLQTSTQSSSSPTVGISPLLLWSRQENNCNHATEENHNNLQTESISSVREVPRQTNRAGISTQNVVVPNHPKITVLDSKTPVEVPETNAVAQPKAVKPQIKASKAVKATSTENAVVPNQPKMTVVDAKATVEVLMTKTKAQLEALKACLTQNAALPINLKVETKASVEVPETKTKAQLKAERKAAFELSQKVVSVKPDSQVVDKKSKTLTKAERREVQEAQRAAKMTPDTILKPQTEIKLLTTTKVEKTNLCKIEDSEKQPKEKVKKASRHFRLFSHLPQHILNPNLTSELGFSGSVIHPAIIRVGLRMAQGVIRGSNARCIASLAALKQVIQDYTTPPQKELSRDLDAALTPQTQFLCKCRPPSASMLNAIKRLRWEISQVATTKTDSEAKSDLLDSINRFIVEDVILAKKGVSECAGKKIADGDVILTYSCSSLVKQVLFDAQAAGKHFRVIVVDSRPALEGRNMLSALTKQGIGCTYIWINAVSYVIKEVTKVFLGCHSLLANGYVMSKAGSCQVALVAHASNVPVLVCCETYKFCERVHTDAFVYNELGDPNDLVKGLPAGKIDLCAWQNIPSLNLVNLTYDVMPAQLVTAIITELQMLPCTSVPVVLRVKHHITQEV